MPRLSPVFHRAEPEAKIKVVRLYLGDENKGKENRERRLGKMLNYIMP